MRIKPVSP